MIVPFKGGALRPLTSADAPAIAKLINDRDIWLQLRDVVPHPYSEENAHAFLSRVKADPPRVLGITTNGQLAGVIGGHALADVERNAAEIGYWLGKTHHGRGLATSALRAFIPYFFSTFPFTRLQACVFEGNRASMNVLAKCGFTAEGILRKAVTKDGRRLDMHVFGLLKEEAEERPQQDATAR